MLLGNNMENNMEKLFCPNCKEGYWSFTTSTGKVFLRCAKCNEIIYELAGELVG
jgi:uncharacterized protein with PIN domain